MFYTAAYAAMNVGAFAVVSHFANAGERYVTLEDYEGLGRTSPLLAATFTIFLLSLIGIPMTGGFFAKFYVFSAAMKANLIWLTIIGVVNSAIGAYYYLRIIVDDVHARVAQGGPHQPHPVRVGSRARHQHRGHALSRPASGSGSAECARICAGTAATARADPGKHRADRAFWGYSAVLIFPSKYWKRTFDKDLAGACIMGDTKFSPTLSKELKTPGGEQNVQTDSQALVGRCGARHRRICGDVGSDSGSGGGHGTLDRVECQQRILQRRQLAPVTVASEFA